MAFWNFVGEYSALLLLAALLIFAILFSAEKLPIIADNESTCDSGCIETGGTPIIDTNGQCVCIYGQKSN